MWKVIIRCIYCLFGASMRVGVCFLFVLNCPIFFLRFVRVYRGRNISYTIGKFVGKDCFFTEMEIIVIQPKAFIINENVTELRVN